MSAQYAFDCTNCPNVPALNAMIEAEKQISYRLFRRLVGPAEVDRWAAAHHYDTGAERGGLRLVNDWHVSYHRSAYDSKPVLFIRWSAIESVFFV